MVNPLGTFTHAYAGETGRPLSITHSGGFDTVLAYLGADDDRALETITSKRPGGTQVARHTYGYDDLGRISSWERESLLANPSGPTSSFEWVSYYDFSSQLTSVVKNNPLTGSLEGGWDYGYDAAGNMTSVQTVTDTSQPALITRRGHNALNQIDSLGGTGKTMVRGSIDEPGQVAIGSAGGGLQPARMLEGNRFEAKLQLATGSQTLRVSATDGNGNTSDYSYRVNVAHESERSFSYDDNGNMLSDGIRTYQWDSLSRLTKVTWDATKSTEFKYNALGQRCERIDLTGTTETAHFYYLFDGTGLVNRYTGGTAASNIDRRYFHEGEQRKNGTSWDSYHYCRDHLGSIREVLKSDGTLVARYDYDPYGKRSAQYEASGYACDLGYTGHITQPSPVTGQTELVMTQFRAYDPDHGRWLSADPIGEEGGLNLYGYIGGNTLNGWDPNGLKFLTWGDSEENDLFPSAGEIAESVSTFGAGLSDNVTMGLTSAIRKTYAGNNDVDKCSDSYKWGDRSGIAVGLAMGGAHAGRNIAAQMGKQGSSLTRLGRGVARFGYDNRRWGSVRRTWSQSQGGLRNKGMSLHHWVSPQRDGWRQGLRNAGFNYVPISARFNSWMNGSTIARRSVERGFRAAVGATELSPIHSAVNDDCND